MIYILKVKNTISTLICLFWINSSSLLAQDSLQTYTVNFFGDTLQISFPHIPLRLSQDTFDINTVVYFYTRLNQLPYQLAIIEMTSYKNAHSQDDWLFYQLIRSTAEKISPKATNYQQYTLLKWFLLLKTGYNASISTCGQKLLLMVQSNDDVYEQPGFIKNNRPFICLNYHDYDYIDFASEKFREVPVPIEDSLNPFTFKITRLPNFNVTDYEVKSFQFDYGETAYKLNVPVTAQVKKIFANYPIVDYATYFNIPISSITERSLVTLLKEVVDKLSQKQGVDYLMRFTRHAFQYQTDTKIFGKEKRLSPEQTLLYDYSDCEDRAALFFFLVKEIYNLPMIVLSYPDHITIAIHFDKPVGKPLLYKGEVYSVCEATPQRADLKIGQGIKKLKNVPYEIVYEYHPAP